MRRKSLTLLNSMTLTQLAKVYNEHADTPVNHFSEKKVAVYRTKKVLELKGLEIYEDLGGNIKTRDAKETLPRAHAVGEKAARFLEHEIIEVLVEENPKKKGSKAYRRFELYEDGMQVVDYLIKCQRLELHSPMHRYLGDIGFDSKRGYIRVKASERFEDRAHRLLNRLNHEVGIRSNLKDLAATPDLKLWKGNVKLVYDNQMSEGEILLDFNKNEFKFIVSKLDGTQSTVKIEEEKDYVKV